MNPGQNLQRGGIEVQPLMPEKISLKKFRNAISEGTLQLQELDGALARGEIALADYTELLHSAFLEQAALKQNLEKKIGIDFLTGAYNKGASIEKIPKLIEQMNSKEARRGLSINAVMMIAMDIDEFKQVNELYGHPAGNKAIQTAANRFKEVVQEFGGDMVFRTGGDEFQIFLLIRQELSDVQLKEIFLRIQDKVNTDLVVEIGEENGVEDLKETLRITIAMGYAFLRKDDTSSKAANTLFAQLENFADSDQLADKTLEVKNARMTKNKSILRSSEVM